MIRLLTASSVVALLIVLGSCATAEAASGGGCSGGAGWRGAHADCYSEPESKNPLTEILDDGHSYQLVPRCEVGGTALCHDPMTCTDADGNEGIYYELYRDGEATGTYYCITDDDARDAGVVTPGLVAAAFKRLEWPKSDLVIQPPKGRTLINFDTNFFTRNTTPTTQTVRLLGQRITIEATPAEYTWIYDDGDTDTTSHPGAPYPDLDVTHDYAEATHYRPRVDTTYVGRYKIGNGPWQDIPATLTVPGATQRLEAVEARPVLVG